MGEKTVIHAIEMCAVKAQQETVWSTESLAIRSVVEDVLKGRVVTGHIQNNAMRVVLQPAMIQAVTDAFRKNDDLMAPIATFVSNYPGKESNSFKMEEEILWCRIKIRELLPSPPTSDPSDNYNMPPKDRKEKTFSSWQEEFKEV